MPPYQLGHQYCHLFTYNTHTHSVSHYVSASELPKCLVNENLWLVTSARKTLRDATLPDKLLQQDEGELWQADSISCTLLPKTSTKIARLQQHTAFNRRCRRYRLHPRCLRVKPLVRTAEGHKIAESASPKFLAARIQDCYHKTRQLEHDLFFQKRQVEFALQPDTSKF